MPSFKKRHAQSPHKVNHPAQRIFMWTFPADAVVPIYLRARFQQMTEINPNFYYHPRQLCWQINEGISFPVASPSHASPDTTPKTETRTSPLSETDTSQSFWTFFPPSPPLLSLKD